jgi:hypothetical protein
MCGCGGGVVLAVVVVVADADAAATLVVLLDELLPQPASASTAAIAPRAGIERMHQRTPQRSAYFPLPADRVRR